MYLFHGRPYPQLYDFALDYIKKKLTQSIFFFNHNSERSQKEELETFLYYFSIESDSADKNIYLIEHPEKLSSSLFSMLEKAIESNHTGNRIALVTQYLHRIPKTIISRSFSITLPHNDNEEEEEEEEYGKFIQALQEEFFLSNTIESLLEKHRITEENTLDATEELLKKVPILKNEIVKVRKTYNAYIKNSHILYWKSIFIILKNKLDL
jgi:DNA polymerase III delta prime subunit